MARSLSLLTSAVLLALAACPSPSSRTDGAWASAEMDVAPHDDASCAAVCAQAATARCAGFDESACVDACTLVENEVATKPAACQAALAQLRGCLAADPAPRYANGELDPTRCRVARDGYRNRCLLGVPTSEPCGAFPASHEALCGAGEEVKQCRGVLPAGCRPGGDARTPDTFCCGDPTRLIDGGVADAGLGAELEALLPAAKACALASACGSFGFPLQTSAPIGVCAVKVWDERSLVATEPGVPASRAYACGASATGCASFGARMSLGHAASECGGGTSACAGDTVVTCWAGQIDHLWDCTAGGNHCDSSAGFGRCVSQATCSAAGGRCVSASSAAVCAGAPLVETSTACLPGTACVSPAGTGVAKCLSTTSCATPNTARCDGTVLKTCLGWMNSLTSEESFDCASRPGSTCASGACRGASECTQTSCAGSTLQLCMAGKRVPVDCAALGRTCGPDS